MSVTERPDRDALLDLVAAALDDLVTGDLDHELPDVGSAATDRERELIGRLREAFASRQRAARRLAHLASALSSEIDEVRARVAVAASANAGVAQSAETSEAAASGLSQSARRVSAQANELHRLIDAAAEKTADVAENGQAVARDSAVLSAAIKDIAESAGSIAAAMRDVDRSVGSLASELGKTSSSVNSINTAIQQIDGGAAETSALSEEMAIAAQRGREVVSQTASAVEGIASATAGVQRAMERLEQRSDEVSEITKIIQTIAVQLKLLAVNASIQASHAGEAGRGFAVVAREIKQLSDSTTASTRGIEAVVRSIRSEIAEAVDEARASGVRAEEGMALAVAAREALATIAHEVELIRSRVLQISGATSSQATETGVLKRAVTRVTELAERVRSTSTQRHASSQKVVARAREINGLAERVRNAMADQEQASLGIVRLIEGLSDIASSLEAMAEQQSTSTEALADSIASIHALGRESHASVAAMAYTTGLLERQVISLEEEARRARTPRPRDGGRVVVPLTLREFDLDPLNSISTAHSSIVDCLFERLVESGEGGRIRPALAESWEVTGDGLTYTFRLRAARFHDGRPVTAADVAYSLARVLRDSRDGAFILSSLRGAGAARAGAAGDVEGLAVVDERTVRVELSEPIAFFPELLALPFASVVPAGWPGAGGHDAPVGSGPYRLAGRRDSAVVLARHDGYDHGPRPHLDEIEFRGGLVAEDLLDGVLRGDFAYAHFLPRHRIRELLESPRWRWRLQSAMMPETHYFFLNSAPGHLEDLRVRRAVALAIDRDALVERFGGEMFAVAARGLVPPSVPGAPALDPAPHDPALARALLAESGFDMARPIDLVYSQAAWALGERVIEGVAADLAAVGLRAAPRRAGDLAEVRRSGEYDVVEAMWMGDYLDPDAFTFAVFHSGVGAYRGIHSSAELDELMADARGTTDLARRAALYDAVEKRFRERCGVLALLHPKDFVLQAQDVEGLELYPQPPNVRPRELWLRGAGGTRAPGSGL